MPPPRHLHPTIPAYVASRALAETYDGYFAASALFRHDEQFLAEHLGLPPTPDFADCLARAVRARRDDENNPSDAPVRRALDLGFGTGRHALRLARAGWAVTGVDLNPHMIDKAAERLAAAGIAFDRPRPAADGSPLPPGGDVPGAVRAVMADWHALPFDDGERFDAILLLFSALGLVRPASRRAAWLRSLRARMRPGAVVLLHVHNARFHPDGAPLTAPASAPSWWSALLGRRATTPPPESNYESATDTPPARDDDPRAGEDASRSWEAGDRIMRRYRGADVDLFLHAFTGPELRDLLASTGYRIREWRPLSAGRATAYHGSDPDREANGFLVCIE